MNKRNKIIVSIVGITIVLLALLGITYAYYLTRIEGNTNTNSISITTAKLELVYGDGNGEIIAGNGALVPSSDPIGIKNFTVTNNGNDSEYTIVIDNVKIKMASTNADTTFLSNDFRYTLTCTITSADVNRNNKECNNVLEQKLFPVNGGVLLSNTIKEGDVHNYKLTLWYIDTGIDQSEDMGKTYQARINIKDITTENPYKTGVTAKDNKSLAYNIINNARINKNGTTLVNIPLTIPVKEPSAFKYIKIEDSSEFSLSQSNATDYYVTYSDDYFVDESTGKFTLINIDKSTPKTIKFSNSISVELLKGKYAYWNTDENKAKEVTDISTIYKISDEDIGIDFVNNKISYNNVIVGYESVEKVLVTSQDNYGTTYYYRGGVQDNYVLFNNMCFRIVRIEGDGGVKLTLAGEVGSGATDCTSVTDSSAVINDGEGTTYGYKTITGLNNKIWYIADYENNVAGVSKTSLKDSLESWFNSKFKSNGELTINGQILKNETWCLGGSFDYKYNYDTGILLDEEGLKEFSTNNLYYWNYSSARRIHNENMPDLTCGYDETKIISKVATLTIDEVALAGASKKLNIRHTNYLYDNSKLELFWTLSRGDFYDDFDSIYIVNRGGAFIVYDVYNTTIGVRPAITLVSGTKIIEGDGTIDNPYVIDVSS